MIPLQVFGRTGHISTRAVFGAAGLGKVTQANADRTLELLLRHGVNHIDTAASYGESERRIGPWMPRHRPHFFLASKTGDRRYKEALESIQRSLERLQTDHLDLIQLHNLVDSAEWEVALGPGGALEAVVEARRQGMVRYIGVTGHGLTVAARHLQSLGRFDFDSVLLPYSYVLNKHPQYAADVEALMEVCAARNVAVQTIKAITRRPWGDRPQTQATWYEALTEPADISRAVGWVLGRPGIFFCTAGDIDLLPKVLEAAHDPQPRPSDAAMEAMLAEREMAPLFMS